jgi:hypothetical protein
VNKKHIAPIEMVSLDQRQSSGCISKAHFLGAMTENGLPASSSLSKFVKIGQDTESYHMMHLFYRR